MIKLLFVCHGNICRSPMAESVMAYLIEQNGLQSLVGVASAAAHRDEIGNPPHRGTVEILKRKGIPLIPHRARLMTRSDGETFDLLLGMDEYNVRDMKAIVGAEYAGKVKKLLDFSSCPRAIADPWYTGDFETTFADVFEGCNALLKYVVSVLNKK